MLEITLAIALALVFLGGFLLGCIALCVVVFGINTAIHGEELQFWTIETLLSGLGLLLMRVLESLSKLPRQAGS
jgi:hypothetical protein